MNLFRVPAFPAFRALDWCGAGPADGMVAGVVTVEWNREPPERSRLVEQEIRRMTDRLAELGAQRVVLFGSRARGDPGALSDIDLLVVMPCDPRWTFARRLAEIGAQLDPRLATDLLVYSPEEIEQLRHSSAVVRRALAEGRILYTRRDA